MVRCCDTRGCDDVFGRRFARRMARRYRRRGLDRTARRMVEFLESNGLSGATVLEIGGGIGEIEIELLKRGAGSSVNLELSAAYDAEAARLLDEQGLTGRAVRRLHDIAAAPDGVGPADVVVLHRVVCCYPDYERLLTAAGDHAQRMLVFSFPRYNPAARALVAIENLGFRISRREFRTFAHPPAAMQDVLAAAGLRPAYSHRGLAWQVSGLVR
jgi:magnesium-protoporphyrin O-methyltransferase